MCAQNSVLKDAILSKTVLDSHFKDTEKTVGLAFYSQKYLGLKLIQTTIQLRLHISKKDSLIPRNLLITHQNKWYHGQSMSTVVSNIKYHHKN